jgi:SAM-dependent methyltransferase
MTGSSAKTPKKPRDRRRQLRNQWSIDFIEPISHSSRSPMPETSPTSFFDSWQTYQKVVAANYMYHREIMADIEVLLRAQFAGRAISVLDLGCGDAATLAPCLQRLALARYKGVDLSQPALALAANHLKSLACPVELTHCDILAALDAETGFFDVIYSSFALHHLATEQKAAFFQLAARRLAPGGILVLTDVMREDGETLPVYLGHYCGWLCRDWDSLDAAEKAAICDHIQNNDRPETIPDLQSLAVGAGLAPATPVARYRWHHILQFQHRPVAISASR